MGSEESMEKGIPQDSQHMRKGGIRTLPFIIANEALEKVPSFALMPSMTLYLKGMFHMNIASLHNMINYWQAFGNLAPILAAFLADSYLGRFLTVGLGSIFSLLGMIIMWLTSILPHAKPPPCNQLAHETCKSATTGQMAILITALVFMAIGAGGIRTNSMPFGADQLTNKSEKILESYFSWYFAAANLGISLGLTVVVYILQTYGWSIGFGVSTILMSLATLSFYLASPLYIKRKAATSLFTGFAQVVSAASKNRNLPYPSTRSSYHHEKESDVLSENLKFLNKACIIRNAEQDIGPDGLAVDPWKLCTVQKVEELKRLFKVMPIWSTTIIMSITGSQHSFPVLQASSVNRHMFGSFSIPPGSMTILVYGTIVVWLVLYDRVLIPLASKIKGKQVYLGIRVRMGIGLFFSMVAMAATAIIESVRRKRAIQQGLLHNPTAMVNMSVYWLFPQFILLGISESFSTLGQFEFYQQEFPETMKSIGNSLFFLSLAVAHLMNNVLFNIVNKITSSGGKTSWVANNLNEAQFDKFYWLLVVFSFFNLFYYIVCSRCYGSTAEVLDQGSDTDEE
ncbi:Proton-dependent oligopeptide transporter family [Corchorus olitorius]|uniref:Proton-dependent oligopeptide transporter family n=1 Tax=Corchorus olitorius TaxID=93759 RepID=A0A1R3JZ09_9ROSI|nr:Proton-dependent oligopeptide transporter family [Corchorus olitorius]